MLRLKLNHVSKRGHSCIQAIISQMPPDKYEYDSKDLIYPFTNSIREMNNWDLVTPYHGLVMQMASQLYDINLCRVVSIQ